MNKDLAEQIRALMPKITQAQLYTRGEHFTGDGFDDLTTCYHGDTGRFRNKSNGAMIALLWNNLPAILKALEGSDG